MTHASRKLPATFAALLLAATLPACSILPKQAPAATYQLPLQHPAQARSGIHGPRADGPILVIHSPASNRVLDSDRVIIAQPDGRLAAWQGLRWADTAPVLLRDRLAEAFIQDGRLTVHVDSAAPAAELDLLGALRAFQVEQRGTAPVVAIRLDAQLAERDRAGAGVSRRFEVVHAAASKRETDVIAAFGAASDALAAQVVDWVLEQPTASATGSDARARHADLPSPAAAESSHSTR
ncbi:membrane integrity-associated transporter subunit PqiC [Pseudomonas aeruginosa]|nr:membrane integrity-associated transporter subunit PqiC [Pseudomonas aeruginosa]